MPINRVVSGGKSPRFVELVAFAFSHPCCFRFCWLSLLHSFGWLCMVHIKHAAHPISDSALPETRDMASKDVTEALSRQREDSADATSSRSHDDSPANTSDSDSKRWSSGSSDTAPNQIQRSGQRSSCPLLLPG
jgi:hypothetical protein